jgi:hypothetical protein
MNVGTSGAGPVGGEGEAGRDRRSEPFLRRSEKGDIAGTEWQDSVMGRVIRGKNVSIL